MIKVLFDKCILRFFYVWNELYFILKKENVFCFFGVRRGEVLVLGCNDICVYGYVGRLFRESVEVSGKLEFN